MKRSFLLLEVVIALTLLALLAGFIFQSPIGFLTKEKQALAELAKASLYQKTLDDLKLLFFKNEISLDLNQKKKVEHFLDETTIDLESLGSKKICRYYKYSFDPQKKALGKFGQTVDLMRLEISFASGKKFNLEKKEFLLVVQKLPPAFQKPLSNKP